MSGGPFRVIEGGRTGEPTPGLLIVGAQEIATLEGGVRRGAEQGDIGRLVAEDLASIGVPTICPRPVSSGMSPAPTGSAGPSACSNCASSACIAS